MAAMIKKALMLVGILVSLFFSASADSGFATFYNIYNPSACLGSNTPTRLIAAASPQLWNNGEACRNRYRVTCTDGTNLGTPHPCTGNTVEVEIVDLCPGCRGTLDLSEDAFAAIANTDAGFIKIEYHRI